MKAGELGKIGVIAGGQSTEREISLNSGRAVYDVLSKREYDVELIEIKEDPVTALKNRKIDVAFIVLHGGSGEDGTVQQYFEEAGIP